jgi:hypothetical protein
MNHAYPESTHALLMRLRDDPAAAGAELRALQDAIPDVLTLIETDLEIDRIRGLQPDQVTADQRRDLLDGQNWKRTDALNALSMKR